MYIVKEFDKKTCNFIGATNFGSEEEALLCQEKINSNDSRTGMARVYHVVIDSEGTPSHVIVWSKEIQENIKKGKKRQEEIDDGLEKFENSISAVIGQYSRTIPYNCMARHLITSATCMMIDEMDHDLLAMGMVMQAVDAGIDEYEESKNNICSECGGCIEEE